MKTNIDVAVGLILIVLGLVFLTNPALISWFPQFVHYIVGALAILVGLLYGMKGLK